jgi:hypothetical protein
LNAVGVVTVFPVILVNGAIPGLALLTAPLVALVNVDVPTVAVTAKE